MNNNGITLSKVIFILAILYGITLGVFEIKSAIHKNNIIRSTKEVAVTMIDNKNKDNHPFTNLTTTGVDFYTSHKALVDEQIKKYESAVPQHE